MDGVRDILCGFNAKHEPVSTLYPELIAKFAGKFDQYGLNLKIGNSAIKKVWFICGRNRNERW